MLSDKVIIITGGGGFIGAAFAKSVTENRGIAIVADINTEAGEKVVKKILTEDRGARLEFVVLDITSRKSINDLTVHLAEKYGKIDALVNNAYPRNRNYGKNIEDVTFEDFCENVNLHLGGYFLVSQQLALFFKKQGYGNIVNIASIYGVVPPKLEIYKGTDKRMPVEAAVVKSAVIHLTKYMAKYYKGKNIRCNAISPGGILNKNKNQTDIFLKKYRDKCLNKGMLDREDLTGTLIYLLSDMSQYVNGQNIIVDDGFVL